jgi:serine/threonine protein kinase
MMIPKQVRQYTILKKLGNGTFGHVYQGRNASGENVAVKFLHTKRHNTLWDSQTVLMKEYNMMKEFDNEHIMKPKFLDFKGEPALVMPLYSSDIAGYMRTHHTGMGEANALYICLMIARAVKCIHDKGYVHRDIKMSNIMFCGEFESVVLCDFGCTAEEKDILPYAMVGTTGYAAPEIVINAKRSKLFPSIPVGKPSDIFSLGVTLFYMVAGELPTEERTTPNEADIEHNIYSLTCSATFKDLLRGMLEIDPCKRLTIEQVICKLENM